MEDVEEPVTSAPVSNASSTEDIQITFTHHGTSHTFPLPPNSTITDLSLKIHTDLSIPPENQKFMITPRLGILKPPFSDPSLRLSTISNKRIVLLAPLPSELSALEKAAANSRPSPRTSAIKPATPARHRDWRKVQDEVTYSFHSILPLSYLPNPERSKRFLERLANDAGIKASMRKHKFSEQGEVIELRLRADAYDGYRDYKVIRKTLCHELAHNVFGEHDRHFWDLTRDIEKEVEANDWRSGGHALTNEEFYNPNDRGVEGEHMDGGGWTGGEFVLGGSVGKSGSGAGVPTQGLSRREAIAKAAEDRIKKQRDVGKGGGPA
ncbi:ribonuclease 3 [Physcia stellaris]|nr:ribonuclease 3 [Physcia stellaris]